MKAKTVIKHLEKFCNINDYVIRDDEAICLLLTWKGGTQEFSFTYGLDGLTKWGVYNLLTKQLDSKPKVTNKDRLFFFQYLTKKQQRLIYKYEPKLYGKVYKRAKGVKGAKEI